jgi:hypothetical protein
VKPVWVGRVMFDAGMDLGRWELSISLFLRMRCASVMVGPFYAEVCW